MLFPVRWVFVWLARRTGSLENGPTPFMMTVTLLVVLISSFMTDVLGGKLAPFAALRDFTEFVLVHAIFGGFIAGLIVPHEGGFAIALVDKLEDLVTLLFIPLVSYIYLKLPTLYLQPPVLCVVRFEDEHGFAR